MTSHLVVVVTILILKISGAKAACYWNGATSCLIYCINMDASTIIEPIENLYAEREACHDEFTLRLRTLRYPSNTIGPFWFSAHIKVAALEVHFNDVEGLSADAFNTDAFRTVKKLTFENFRLPLIVNESFNGLDVLETINVNGAAAVSRIETGVLDNLTELKEFTFEQSTKSPELNIDGFTGSSVLSKLEYVKIRYNLATSIKTSTFVGLRSVKRLDLSSCYISLIEDNSFDPISDTIEELNLSGNELTTVAYGVFSVALPNIRSINVNGNRWDCVCDLMAFRLFIEQYRENFIGYDCSSPTHCRISNILESDCFDACEVPSTTEITTTENPETTAEDPETTTENPETTTENPETTTDDTTPSETTTTSESNITIECSDLSISDIVSIERPIGYMTITENENGEANLNVETEEDINSLVVIRSERSNSGDTDSRITCVSQSDSSGIFSYSDIPIADLKDDTLYSYCLMRKTSSTVSPLDCIPYMRKRNEMNGDRLLKGSIKFTIALAAVCLVMWVSFGMAVTF